MWLGNIWAPCGNIPSHAWHERVLLMVGGYWNNHWRDDWCFGDQFNEKLLFQGKTLFLLQKLLFAINVSKCYIGFAVKLFFFEANSFRIDKLLSFSDLICTLIYVITVWIFWGCIMTKVICLSKLQRFGFFLTAFMEKLLTSAPWFHLKA